ncbi:MAG: transporter substrate-binding domain-containing protein [Oscillospiraceae bacterium]|nr:transporter substrate-binding domain-containing protein [Oscillospiraceae bacterium]
MKKIIAIALAAMMLLSMLAGCSNKKVTLKILDTEYALENYAICVAKENQDLLNKINTALDGLIKDGTAQKIIDKYISGTPHDLTFQQNTDGKEELVMATNAYFPPYEYYEGGKIVGIDAEMAAAIADKLDMKLVIEDTEFGSIIAGVQTGKYDMGMAGMTVTEDRLKEVNFSTSYATGVQVVIVAEGSEIATVDDLLNPEKNYKVGVQQDTTGDIYLSSSYEDGGVGEANVVRYKTGNEAVQALLTGKVDAVVIDQEPAKSYVATNNK